MEMISHLLHEAEIWVAIGFVVFVIVVWKKAKVAMFGGLDARSAKIAAQIEEATKLRAEAEAMLKTAEAKLKDAGKEAAELLADAKAQAERLAAETKAELSAHLERRKQAAVEKIAQAEAAALAEVRNVAVDVAIAATTRLLAEQVQGKVADQLIDNAIADLGQQLN